MAMANSKKTKKKPSDSNHDDIDALKSDVASFASSLGLSSSLPSSGFNDTDFTNPKKSQPLHTHQPKTNPEPKNNQNKHTHFPKTKQKPTNNPNKPLPNPYLSSLNSVNDNNDNKGGIFRRFRNDNKPNKPSVLSLDNGNDNNDNKGGIFRRFRNVPRVSLVKASDLGVWYVDLAELEERVVKGNVKVGIEDVEEWKRVCERKREMGERLMGQYVEEYEGTRGQSGDIRMLVNTQRSGTAVDKVSAFSVLVGDNPVANLRSLDALLGMVTSKVGKRHALTGFEALQELFVSSLLPDRKLKTLIQRPLNHLPDNKDGHSLLLFWYFEECLKQRYERFVIALEEASKDMLPILKNKAIKSIYVLLRSKSEQERRLLSALVNKLGDPDNKAASNADFHLSNLMSDHPNMKGVVIDEVDTFLFRPHLGPRAQYHVVNFLSQIRLSHRGDGPKVAKRLVDVYFALFKVLISGANSNQTFDESKKDINKKAGKREKSKDAPESHAELDSRLLSALLTGVNRAFPFVSSDEADDIVDAQTPVLFQLVHSKNFNVGLQALMLLDKISSKNQIASDRFYRALYSKLLLPAAMHTSKVEMFIGLILRAMKRDVNLKRVAAFSKRLLQMALQQPAQFACACLFLLSELLKARPPLWNLMLQNESIDDEVEHFEDVKEETDPAATNKQADVGPVQNGDDHNSEDESSEKEDDLPKSSESEDDSDYASEEADFVLASNEKVPENSKHVSDDEKNQSQSSSNKSLLPGGYDPRHREPSFCNADRVSWWELIVLASHSHPSVATMARTLLSGANIVYNGNPLNDLSLTAFLDKFMEKKPKQSLWHGGSQIEPAKQMGINNHLIGPEILSLAEEDVQPEDLVFHKFYTNKMHSSKRPKKKKKKTANEEAAEDLFDVDGSDVDVDGGDESDNEEIENLLDDADQSLGGDGEYDYDDLDKVADEDDEDLIGDVSDGDMEAALSDIAEEFSDTPMEGDDDDVSEDEDDIDIGDVDDDSDADAGEEAVVEKRKTKGNKKSSASPFASYEDYEHLMEDDNQADDKRTEEPSSQKKRKRKTKKDDDNKTEEPSSKKSKSKKKRR